MADVVEGILLMTVGFAVLAMAVAWQNGHWPDAARWLLDHSSAAVVVALPFIGMLLMSLGGSLIWPPAVLFAFPLALAVLAVLVWAARRDPTHRLPPTLQPVSPPAPPAQGGDARGTRTAR